MNLSNHGEWVDQLTHQNKNLLSKIDLYLDHQLDPVQEELIEVSLTQNLNAKSYFETKSRELELLESLIPRLEVSIGQSTSFLVKKEVGEILYKRERVRFLEYSKWYMLSILQELKELIKSKFK